MAMLNKILPEHFRRIAALMTALTEGERRTMVRLLGKIAARAAEEFPPADSSSSGRAS